MSTLFLTKVSKFHDGEKTASSTNVVGKSGYPCAKKLIVNPCLSSCSNINSKWINNLNIRPNSEVSTGKSRKHF
jgi:hypothetical protein